MSDTALTLTIDRVGRRGEGVADGPIFVPYTLPGEHVRVWRAGERAELDAVLEPSPDRIAPFCPYFGTCGGCAIQHWAAAAYQDWKRGLVVTALTRANITTPVAPLRDAFGQGRRRVTFHARTLRDALGHRTAEVGFMRARAHTLVSIEQCPVLAPELDGAVLTARRVAALLRDLDKPLDILITATEAGLDVDLRGCGALSARLRQAAIGLAHAQDLARLSNHGDVLIERRPPTLMFGAARVTLPAGGFLQATTAGEAALVAAVREAVGPARRIADLFAGVGTFTLPLAQQTEVHAFEQDRAALAALTRGAGGSGPALRPVTAQVRDLVGRPLAGAELDPYDAVVLDPPRAGAEAQMRALAPSKVPLVISVSCAVETFARDAALLLAGGYVCESVRPFDQFRHTPHVEIVGVFRRAPPSRKRLRRLLG